MAFFISLGSVCLLICFYYVLQEFTEDLAARSQAVMDHLNFVKVYVELDLQILLFLSTFLHEPKCGSHFLLPCGRDMLEYLFLKWKNGKGKVDAQVMISACSLSARLDK